METSASSFNTWRLERQHSATQSALSCCGSGNHLRLTRTAITRSSCTGASVLRQERGSTAESNAGQHAATRDCSLLLETPHRCKLLTSFSIDLNPLRFDDVALHVLEVWFADTRLHWERLLFLIRSRDTVLVSSELNPCVSNGHSMPLCPLGSRLSLP